MKRVENFVRRLRNMYGKQVVIETKLLEVQLRKSHESGLDLQLPHLQFTGDMNGVKYFKDNVTYADAMGTDQPFTVFLKYLSLQGQVSVLSSPRITTMNKQKAVIKIGRDNYYLVGTDTQSSTQNDAISTSLTLQPFFSGIALDVTPEIQEDNKINLHIHPLISEVVGKDYSFQLGGESSESYMLNLPESTVRESDSVIQAYSGQFIAIGGLMKRKTESTKKSLPKLFGKKTGHNEYRDFSDTTELVIVLWPKIVDLEDSGLTPSVDMQGQDTYTYGGTVPQGVGK
jgi:MSHA biogenesis protein MshL